MMLTGTPDNFHYPQNRCLPSVFTDNLNTAHLPLRRYSFPSVHLSDHHSSTSFHNQPFLSCFLPHPPQIFHRCPAPLKWACSGPWRRKNDAALSCHRPEKEMEFVFPAALRKDVDLSAREPKSKKRLEQREETFIFTIDCPF